MVDQYSDYNLDQRKEYSDKQELSLEQEQLTSTPPMQNRTTRTSTNQNDINLYSITKKHEAITTNKIAAMVLIST